MPESSFFIWINPERRILVLRSTTKGRFQDDHERIIAEYFAN
jgi:hypothetical protein